MKILLVCAICCLIVLGACKKNTAATPISSVNTSANATITPTSAYGFYAGLFDLVQTQTMLTVHPATYSYTAFANATFRTGDTIHYKNVFVNSVSINSLAMSLLSDTSYSLTNVTNTTCTWQIVGQGSIPSFTYTSPIPMVVNISSLPDTIDHTKPISIFIQTNTPRILDVFIGGTSVFNYTNSDTATFNFTASSMASLAIGNNTMQIECESSDNESVNGSKMNFFIKKIFVKPVYIK